MSIFKDGFTQFKDSGEVTVHLIFEFIDLLMSKLIFRVVKDFLAEHFKDGKVVLADIHIFHGGSANFVDEVSPGGIPFIFDNLDQYAITF